MSYIGGFFSRVSRNVENNLGNRIISEPNAIDHNQFAFPVGCTSSSTNEVNLSELRKRDNANKRVIQESESASQERTK